MYELGTDLKNKTGDQANREPIGQVWRLFLRTATSLFVQMLAKHAGTANKGVITLKNTVEILVVFNPKVFQDHFFHRVGSNPDR